MVDIALCRQRNGLRTRFDNVFATIVRNAIAHICEYNNRITYTGIDPHQEIKQHTSDVTRLH
jgi:hypothetical protein